MASCTGSVKIRGEGLWQFRECSKPTFANVLHIKQKRVFSFPGRSKQARKNQMQWCRIGVSWWDSRSENVLLWDQPILAQGPLGLVVCWLRLPKCSYLGEGTIPKVLKFHYPSFCSNCSVWTSSSGTHVWGKERKFGAPVSGLVLAKEGPSVVIFPSMVLCRTLFPGT